MDPLATPSTNTTTATLAPSSSVGGPAPSQTSQQAFQAALSAALNAPNVLVGAGGDDDDDDDGDGSLLTVGNSMGL